MQNSDPLMWPHSTLKLHNLIKPKSALPGYTIKTNHGPVFLESKKGFKDVIIFVIYLHMY